MQELECEKATAELTVAPWWSLDEQDYESYVYTAVWIYNKF